jgi:hypothetical protein
LTRAAGEVAVTSDSDVRFSECRASLRIENESGGVTGLRSDGIVEITTHKAAVDLTQIMGRLRIAGDELEVNAQSIGAAMSVHTRSSNITVEGSSSVNVENDRGNVVIRRSEALIEVKSEGGEVHLLDMKGPLHVDAAGDVVEVEWSSLGADGDSRISNDAGDVIARFGSADCRVDAISRFGRVESSLPGLRVQKDETAAQGIVGGGGARTIVIRASGYVHLQGAEGVDTQGQAP